MAVKQELPIKEIKAVKLVAASILERIQDTGYSHTKK